MAEWEPLHLHWSFKGEHVLFPFIVLKSFTSFLFASLLLISICIAERLVTAYHEGHHAIEYSNTRWRGALRRSLLYWIAMILRLFYMLAAMTFNIGLIIIIATTLALTQLILDLASNPRPQQHHFSQVANNDPFLPDRIPPSPSPTSTFVALESVTSTTRPRSRSKPDGIFIHPAESNIARADALAMQLGLSGDTERVHGNFYDKPEAKWEAGKGRDVARELLQRKVGISAGVNRNGSGLASHQRTRSFQIGSSDSEDSSSDDGDDSSEVRKLVP